MLDWMELHSIYIHIPFCVRRCLYCDFVTFAGLQAKIPAYLKALGREIAMVGDKTEKIRVGTLYFGGGTPSLLEVGQQNKILTVLSDRYNLSSLSEVTIEANPGTIDEAYLSGLLQSGFNRLSLGAQSALPNELELLGRIHTVNDIRRAVDQARQAGFKNINLDFIYGLPGQTLDDWQASLDLALELQPEHLSCYALTLERDTPLAEMIAGGKYPDLDDDQSAECYEMAMDQLGGNGYRQYEISNWAVTRDENLLSCQHNLQYWHNDSYLGFGVGAHGYSQGIRTANVETLPEYLERMIRENADEFPLSPANETRLTINEITRRQEAMMLGLRLTEEGVARSQYEQKYHFDFYHQYQNQIDRMVLQGLVEWADTSRDNLRLTRRGRLLGNQVFMQFVGEKQV